MAGEKVFICTASELEHIGVKVNATEANVALLHDEINAQRDSNIILREKVDAQFGEITRKAEIVASLRRRFKLADHQQKLLIEQRDYQTNRANELEAKNVLLQQRNKDLEVAKRDACEQRDNAMGIARKRITNALTAWLDETTNN